MNSAFSDIGIIIKTINFGEADKLQGIVSKEKGFIEVVAKGARRITSRKAPHLDLLNLTRFQIARGRSPQVMVQAEVVKSYPNLKTDIRLIRTCFYITEILNSSLALEQPDPQLFISLQNYLDTLNQTQSSKDQRKLTTAFQLYLLRHLGFPKPPTQKPRDILQHIEKVINKKIKSKEITL